MLMSGKTKPANRFDLVALLVGGATQAGSLIAGKESRIER